MDFNEAKALATSAAIRAQAYATEYGETATTTDHFGSPANGIHRSELASSALVYVHLSQMWVRIAEMIDTAEERDRAELLEKAMYVKGRSALEE